ncbi:MAG TPA: AraC family transcriptional regulator [Candidatus Acidoferrales bacterium]|nr:AraC family transcriptional regulator [Candidatus Acidoferrales bacterium]
MDAFSEILAAVKLKGALYFSADFSSPWNVSSPPSKELAPALAPGAPHLLIYHLVVEGKALACTKDGKVLALEPGDIVVFPHGDPHQLMSSGQAANDLTPAIVKKIVTHDLRPLRAGGGGQNTRFVCGYMACDPFLCKPILEGLPSVLKVNIRADDSGNWLENSILHLVKEAASGKAGSDAMLAKLSDSLFVDTLRRYLAGLPEEQTGWLAGARDPIVGRSLAILHSRVNQPWTIADLAREVGLSRSALVDRFSQFLSVPPMTYLTRWRLQLAARALTTTPRGTADIAADVGYESEAAFNRAFKREFKLPPARYRREAKRPTGNGEVKGPTKLTTVTKPSSRLSRP